MSPGFDKQCTCPYVMGGRGCASAPRSRHAAHSLEDCDGSGRAFANQRHELEDRGPVSSGDASPGVTTPKRSSTALAMTPACLRCRCSGAFAPGGGRDLQAQLGTRPWAPCCPCLRSHLGGVRQSGSLLRLLPTSISGAKVPQLPSSSRTLEDQLVVLGRTITADTWREDLNKPPSLGSVLVDRFLVPFLAIFSDPQDSFPQTYKLVLVLLWHWHFSIQQGRSWPIVLDRQCPQCCGPSQGWDRRPVSGSSRRHFEPASNYPESASSRRRPGSSTVSDL